MRVKAGDIVVIDGGTFKIPQESIEAINIWLECLETGISDKKTIGIPLLVGDSQESVYFLPSKIKEALDRQSFNKSRHGL